MRVQKIYPVRRKGRFRNMFNERRQFVLLPSAGMYFRSFIHRLCNRSNEKHKWMKKPLVFSKLGAEARITWIGHSSFLIQLGGITILTDPIWGNATFLFKRIMQPPIEVCMLPPIDCVVISHNHRDHMDLPTLRLLKKINPNMRILVPTGDKKHFDTAVIDNVQEFFWWDSIKVGDACFTFLPAHHWSGRAFDDRNRSLWGSWMIEHSESTIYFAGDTAYWKHFSCIRHYFPRIDVALMPVGPCEPYGHMRHSHLSADLAVRAFCELGAREFIPMHWGTFNFGEDHFIVPIERLKKAWESYSKHVKEKYLHIIKFGDSVAFDHLKSRVIHSADITSVV